MTDSEQLESFMTNYRGLEDGGKDKLLLVGRKLLGIKSLVKREKKREGAIEESKFNIPSYRPIRPLFCGSRKRISCNSAYVAAPSFTSDSRLFAGKILAAPTGRIVTTGWE
jgi:hypothetical protein